MTVFSHRHLLMTFYAHYLLRICTLPPLHSLTQLRSSPLHTYTWRSAALEKLEVAERRSDVLYLTLTTGHIVIDRFIHERHVTNFQQHRLTSIVGSIYLLVDSTLLLTGPRYKLTCVVICAVMPSAQLSLIHI